MAAVDSFSLLYKEICSDLHDYEDIAAFIGVFVISKFLVTNFHSLFNTLRIHFWPCLRENNLHKFGEWAVITGGSDGIGRGFAFALAKRKFNLILIARSKEKLTQLAAELETRFNVKVEIISEDFSTPSSEKFDRISEITSQKDVGILVNNVGIMPSTSCYFEDMSEQQLLDTVNINCVTTMLMTHRLLPDMVKRKRGLIVNISSIAGLKPIPFLSVYSASKIFIEYLSDSLAYEYGKHGIHFQVITPSLVRTSTVQAKLVFGAPDAITFSEKCVTTFGRTKKTGGIFLFDIFCWLSTMPYECIRLPLSYLAQIIYFGKIQRKAD